MFITIFLTVLLIQKDLLEILFCQRKRYWINLNFRFGVVWHFMEQNKCLVTGIPVGKAYMKIIDLFPNELREYALWCNSQSWKQMFQKHVR